MAERLSASAEGVDLSIQGVVASMPQAFSMGQRFEFDVTDGGETKIPSKIMLSWYQGQSWSETTPLKIRPGMVLQAKVRLKRPHGNANPFGFDYEGWLLERGIGATGYVRRAAVLSGAESRLEMRSSLHYSLENFRLIIKENFFQALPEEKYPLAGILVALVVGDQKAITGDLWNVFNRTGVTHLLSVSGLHITMIAGLMGTIGAWCWRRSAWCLWLPAQRAAAALGWIAALGYTLLSGFAVPAQRTFFMLSVVAIALMLSRVVAASRVLGLALLGVLLLDPWAVLAPGFWLSFCAVAALFYAAQGRLPAVESSWHSMLAQWGLSQWAATMASLPILLMVFQQFSLVSPLANAVAIPVISLVVTPLALLAAILPWPPLLHGLHALLEGLMSFLGWCSQWPVWYAAAAPIWAYCLAAVGVAILLLPRAIPGWGLGWGLILPALFWRPPGLQPGEFRVTVLDVGQGLAALIETAQGATLYDTGPQYSSESDAGQRVVLPFLRAKGIYQLERMIVTHRDSDHAGGAASVLAGTKVSLRQSSMAEWPGEHCSAGQAWFSGGVRFSFLHPEEKDFRQARKTNSMSCVLRLDSVAGSMLLTSDVEAVDEAAMLAREMPLKSDVVLVPHHGSKTSSTAQFLDAVGPREAIVPVGYRNRFGHPKEEVLSRYRQRGIRLWRTDLQGAVTVSFLQSGQQIQAWRHIHRRYWHNR